MLPTPLPIFQFSSASNISNWHVVDDVVMGGVSSGNFNLNNENFGNFFGTISLENNGGFSSLHYKFKSIRVKVFTKVVIEIKGDAKDYQFRIKDNQNHYYSYIYKFSTNNSWQTIEIPFSSMSPVFRGKKLAMENFNANKISQIAFLIANKKNEHFQLLIKGIYLK